MHIFKDIHALYIEKGLPVIPDRYMGKTPLIKGWSEFCHKIPSIEELNQWCTSFDESNIAVCLGERSKVVALDLDTINQEILDIILPLLPKSPVVKKGAKGETRFFTYMGEHTQILKYNGECILELLSNGKKTTIPPSIHPNGEAYKWTTPDTLLTYDLSKLPLIPPMLFTHIESCLRSKIPELDITKNKINTTGRNNDMISLCGTLIKERVDLNEAIKQLIETDKKTNNPPLFSDSNEFKHTEQFTNALNMYNGVLNTVNIKHYRNNTEYEIPLMPAALSIELKEMERLGKITKSGKTKKVKPRICNICNRTKV